MNTMKIIRKAIPAVALLVMLNGCAAENKIHELETQLPTEAAMIHLVPEPTVWEAYAKEETLPVRESEEATEAASEAPPTAPPETELEIATEGKPSKEPAATQPPATEPVPTESSAEKPQSTEPPVTEPAITEPIPTQPPEMTPVETSPPETAPPATEVPETELPKAEINTRELEAYGRWYAASTYGYSGNTNCNPSTNAGYFPGVRVKVTTMEEGYAAAREAVDYQYTCDVAMGRAISVEIDGVTVRRNINLYFEPTDDPQVFILWCYYGGEA
jgi:hypothetical protein